MRRLLATALASLLALAALLWVLLRPATSPPAEQFDVAKALGDAPSQGFARATTPRAFHFPADHGPHPGYRNEWWYFTGNLTTDAGRRFGYELSLFRIALSPDASPRASAWGTNQVYMAHFALTDVAAGKFYFYERFARGGAGLAGAQAAPFAVWLEDWRVESDPRDVQTWHLRAAAGDVAIALALTPCKPVVLQGERGLSRKSAEPGNASYYYSLPRLASDGTITIACVDSEGGQRALEIIKQLTADVEIGQVYTGKVKKITGFGAFVEVLPGKEGLVHISQLERHRVARVEDVVNLGDEIQVKVLEIDDAGKIRLSRRALLGDDTGEPKPGANRRSPSRHRPKPKPRR